MTQALAREIGHMLAGVAFLTRLPVPARPGDGEARLAGAVRWFPLVGALVGCVAGAFLLVAAALLPMPLAAGLAIAAGMLTTGALHEDGLADTIDGLGGGRDRGHALEIMRDSRTGSYGAAALVFSIALRWAALAAMAPTAGAVALIVAHGLSRGMIAPALAFARYARPSGLADAVAGVRRADAAVALLLALALAMLAGPACGLVAFAAAALAAGAMLAILVRRIGGYTGDGLGAVQQLAEIAALVALAACRA